MITEILEKREKDQAPRFFLHDEMKAWLASNLTTIISDQTYDEQYVDTVSNPGTYNAYRHQHRLIGKKRFQIGSMIAGQMIPSSGIFEIDLTSYREVIASLTKRVDYLEQRNQDLRNFINQLESRIIKLEQHANI